MAGGGGWEYKKAGEEGHCILNCDIKYAVKAWPLAPVHSFSSPEPIASFSRRRLGTRHEGLWRHTIPEVLDSRTSGLHVWVIRFILNTV